MPSFGRGPCALNPNLGRVRSNRSTGKKEKGNSRKDGIVEEMIDVCQVVKYHELCLCFALLNVACFL
jgi:hypothetical protein